MANTTVAKVEALLGRTFNTTDRPTIADVTVVLDWADRAVTNEGLTNTNSVDLDYLAALLSAHVISISSSMAFATDGVQVDTRRQSSDFLDSYKRFVSRLKATRFTVVNQ